MLVKEIPSVDNGGVSADGKTITLKLRDDVTWSDGVPLTADDYAFMYDMIMSDQNTPLGRYPYDPYVDSVVAQDATTVVITLNEPFAAWLTSLFYYVIPKHVLQPVFDAEGTIDNAEWNRNPVPGLGPFVLDQWESGSHLSFKANPHLGTSRRSSNRSLSASCRMTPPRKPPSWPGIPTLALSSHLIRSRSLKLVVR